LIASHALDSIRRAEVDLFRPPARPETSETAIPRQMDEPLFVYVDVDDTLVRKGPDGEELPIPHVVDHVRALHRQGAQLHCWSTGGEHHARSIAQQLGIEQCFSSFLHKPQVFIDDERAAQWPHFVHISPDALGTLEEYRAAVAAKHDGK